MYFLIDIPRRSDPASMVKWRVVFEMFDTVSWTINRVCSYHAQTGMPPGSRQ